MNKYWEQAVSFLRANSKTGISFVLKTFLKLQGPVLWLASTLVAKLVELGLITVENAVDKSQDKKAIEEIKEEMKKPEAQRDMSKIDELEREILEGK